jgi:uncharacterized protein (DUF1800 family)
MVLLAVMFSPYPEKLFDRTMAAHLLNRAGFGGTPEEIDKLLTLGIGKAVDFFIHADDDVDLFPRPDLLLPHQRVEFKKREKAALTEDDRKAIKQELSQMERTNMLDLRLWWLNRMRYTSAPLREKVSLFWHGHFATSNQKVNDPYMMWEQNETLRRYALGKFPDMLKAMSRDPAMIRWLDLGDSRKNHPNENFAREVMELFSLGEGHYTEKDIQESARAFTGYRINYDTATFVFKEADFDPGQKTFFGKSGPLTGDDIIDAIVAQPQCARYIGRKLWAFFVKENPADETVSDVAELLLSNGYDIEATLGTIFRSAAFYAPKVVHHQIKGPVQWMMQTTKMLEIPLPDSLVLENSLSSLGQVVFAPPNVKGWDGGRAWISASSLLYRYNLASYLLSGKAHVLGGGNKKVAEIPLSTIAPPETRTGSDPLLNHLSFRIFNYPLPAKDRAAYLTYLEKHTSPYTDEIVRDLMQIMMSTPEYQLT